MLRVGLTGGLGSGKSTVGAMLAAHGAYLLQADEIGRELMRPGQPVYAAIVGHFGPGVVLPDGSLDRSELARLAFVEGRVEELNAIVHPAVIARQAEATAAIGAHDPDAVVVVESALIFETRFGHTQARETRPVDIHTGQAASQPQAVAPSGPWSDRFDVLLLVTASDEQKLARYVARRSGGRVLDPGSRQALEAEARTRLRQQLPDAGKATQCDFVLPNEGSLETLAGHVTGLWARLLEARAGLRS